MLNDYRQKVSKADLEPIVQQLTLINKRTLTDADLLTLNNDEINDILSVLYRMNADIDKIRKKIINNSITYLDKQKELQASAPQVERKTKEPEKPPKNIKKTVQKVKFIPYNNVQASLKSIEIQPMSILTNLQLLRNFPSIYLRTLRHP